MRERLQNGAHGVNLDLQQLAAACVVFRLLGLQSVKIGVRALQKQVARRALPARLVLLAGRLAQQGLGEMPCKRSFACACFAGEQPCIGLVLPMLRELLPCGFVPWVNHFQAALCFARGDLVRQRHFVRVDARVVFLPQMHQFSQFGHIVIHIQPAVEPLRFP